MPKKTKKEKVEGKGEKKSTSDKFFCKKCRKLISKKRRRRHKERCGIKPHRHRGKGTPMILTPEMMTKIRRQMMQRQLPASVEMVSDPDKGEEEDKPVLLTTPFNVDKKKLGEKKR